MNKYSIIIVIVVFLITVSVLAQSPGVQMGTTFYDYQTNGSSGNRIALCEDGSMYICWMNAPNWPQPLRGVSYCWRSPSGNWDCGVLAERGAYPQLDIYNNIYGAIVYHTYSTYIILAIDCPPWEFYDPPDSTPDGGICFWPYITTDRNDRIHILMTEMNESPGDFQRLFYTRSEDSGENWTIPKIVDTLVCLSSVIDASPVSDKVIIAYTHPTDFEICKYNDVVYDLSEDGVHWHFIWGRVNITNYQYDNDSLWAYTDMDVIFDYNDNFHIIWNAVTIDSEGYIQRNTHLFHYNSATEEINLIRIWPEENEWGSGCEPGAWNLPICKMNLGVNESNVLFATWTQFDTTDCSQGGYANGEIYMSYTLDGANWQEPVNLTNSHTPNCYPEECDSDHWSTLADVVNDTLHIVYINDKDAGGIPQNEGVATENPVMYLAVPVDTIVGIRDKVQKPTNFSLNQNYPNPFNAVTNISFELKEPSAVLLEVFNMTGAKVITLVDEYISAGSHSITWNAEHLASGVYYYRLKANSTVKTKRAVLIK